MRPEERDKASMTSCDLRPSGATWGLATRRIPELIAALRAILPDD